MYSKRPPNKRVKRMLNSAPLTLCVSTKQIKTRRNQSWLTATHSKRPTNKQNLLYGQKEEQFPIKTGTIGAQKNGGMIFVDFPSSIPTTETQTQKTGGK